MRKIRNAYVWVILVVALAGGACNTTPMVQADPDAAPSDASRETNVDASADRASDDAFEAAVTRDLQAVVLVDLSEMLSAAKALQAAAPDTAPWSTADVSRMKTLWIRVRAAYEKIEGAISPLFRDLDISLDERYDGFVTVHIKGRDANLFNGEGVTGMHAVERILWAKDIPSYVTEYERGIALNGEPLYDAAAEPKTEAEAHDFKAKLCERLVADTQLLQTQWSTMRVGIGGAYLGLRDLMAEQREKVNLTATGREESRYSQRTMADLRENLAGTRKALAVFKPWIMARGGSAQISNIEAGFDRLEAAYNKVSGEAIPKPPPTWQAEKREKQEPAELATPFGELFITVTNAVDVNQPGSIGAELEAAGKLIGF
jgi:iron uptake system component EfeO